jgi:hypothetical protein
MSVRFRRTRHRWDDDLDITPIAEGLGEDAADREVLAQLRQLGAHLDRDRSLRAYLFFRQQSAAVAAAADLSAAGFTVFHAATVTPFTSDARPCRRRW